MGKTPKKSRIFFLTGSLTLYDDDDNNDDDDDDDQFGGIPLLGYIQVFGIFCTMFGEWLYRVMDDRVANCCLAAILLLGTAMTAIIPSDYRWKLRMKTIWIEGNVRVSQPL